MVSAREQFKWQTAGAEDSLKAKSFETWLEQRNLALRPLYWEISSDVYAARKRGTRATTARNVLECTNVKWHTKIEKGVCRGRDGTSSLLVFRTLSQRGPCTYSEKVSGESHVTRELAVIFSGPACHGPKRAQRTHVVITHADPSSSSSMTASEPWSDSRRWYTRAR